MSTGSELTRSEVESILDQQARQIDELDQRVRQLEYEVKLLVENLPTGTKSKREKKVAILERLVGQAAAHDGGAINQHAAAGAAGCSTRWARTLFAEIDEELPWATYRTGERQQPSKLVVSFPNNDPSGFLTHARRLYKTEVDR